MAKIEKVHFSVAIMLFDMEMQSTSTPMNTRGQGHIVTLTKDHLFIAACQHFQKSSPQKPFGPI